MEVITVEDVDVKAFHLFPKATVAAAIDSNFDILFQLLKIVNKYMIDDVQAEVIKLIEETQITKDNIIEAVAAVKDYQDLAPFGIGCKSILTFIKRLL